ncbi:hypothetical protein CapIbe_003409 [Capra ibex]
MVTLRTLGAETLSKDAFLKAPRPDNKFLEHPKKGIGKRPGKGRRQNASPSLPCSGKLGAWDLIKTHFNDEELASSNPEANSCKPSSSRKHPRAQTRGKSHCRRPKDLGRRLGWAGLVIHHPAEEQLHRCPLCGQTFAQQPSLVRHQKAHAGAGRAAAFVCPECGKAFSVKHNLEVHQRTHTGERPFPCPECGRCFSLKQNLLTHQRIHSGEKPHQCAQCGRCFREPRFLLNHQRTHARMPAPHPRRPGVFGERRPYFCARCGKSFAREGSLKTHQRSHGHGPEGQAAHLGRVL